MRRPSMLAAMLAAALAACARERLLPGDTAGTDTPRAAAPDSVAETSARVIVTHQTERDLTGDGRPERVQVRAAGPSDDSLTVRLEVRGPDGALLYLDRWSSRLYFVYDPLEGKPDSLVSRIVRRHLARLVRDSAFVRPRLGQPDGSVSAVDPDAVRHDVAAHEWRRANTVPDTAALPPAAADALNDFARRAPDARIRALAAELERVPTFTYFAGGEATSTIAWSPTERRFVRIFSCC